ENRDGTLPFRISFRLASHESLFSRMVSLFNPYRVRNYQACSFPGAREARPPALMCNRFAVKKVVRSPRQAAGSFRFCSCGNKLMHPSRADTETGGSGPFTGLAVKRLEPWKSHRAKAEIAEAP